MSSIICQRQSSSYFAHASCEQLLFKSKTELKVGIKIWAHFFDGEHVPQDERLKTSLVFHDDMMDYIRTEFQYWMNFPFKSLVLFHAFQAVWTIMTPYNTTSAWLNQTKSLVNHAQIMSFDIRKDTFLALGQSAYLQRHIYFPWLKSRCSEYHNQKWRSTDCKIMSKKHVASLSFL